MAIKIIPVASACVLAVALAACNGSDSSDDLVSTSDSTTTTTDSTTTSLPIFSSWILNTSEQATNIFSSNTSSVRPLINVQSVAVEAASDQDYVRVEATGVLGYTITFTRSVWLTSLAIPAVGILPFMDLRRMAMRFMAPMLRPMCSQKVPGLRVITATSRPDLAAQPAVSAAA